VKLHNVDEKKPMKELVGRKRKSTQEKIKKHHPKAARGLGDALSARDSDLIIGGDEAIGLGFLQSFCLNSDGTQLVAEFAVTFLPILFFCVRVLTHI
jgi:hypothetical protein